MPAADQARAATRPVMLVTEQTWRAEDMLATDDAVVWNRGWDYPVDLPVTLGGLWAPGEWVDRYTRRTGTVLPVATPSIHALARLPERLTGRAVEVLRYVDIPDRDGWVKFPIAKRATFPATRVDGAAAIARSVAAHNDSCAERDRIGPDTLLQISDHIPGVMMEIRVWVIGTQPVTSCVYADAGEIGPTVWSTVLPPDLDAQVWGTAAAAADALPGRPPAVVVDIAVTKDRRPYVVEFNAAWSSDWYGADRAEVLRAVRAVWTPLC